MSVEAIQTRQQVEEIMRPGGPAAMIDFWADWCAPCRVLGPNFQATAEAMREEDVRFYKVDTEAHPDISAAFNIRSLPTIILVKDGQIIDVLIGVRDTASLIKSAQKLIKRSQEGGFLKKLFGK